MIAFIIGEITKVFAVVVSWEIGRFIYRIWRRRKDWQSIEQFWDAQIRHYLKEFPEAQQAIIVNKYGHVIHTVDRKETATK